jgi:multisubunit Na+/H+ antiporter MnhF subunit
MLDATMDMKNVGGTPGGLRTFLLGLIMAVMGGYLLFQQVQVTGGYWMWGGFGGAGRSFGITLLPLLFGIGMLFANGKSVIGRLLTFGGAVVIIAGVIANLDIHFQQTSLFNVITMLVLLVGGIGLIARSVMPMHPPARRALRDPSGD